MLSAIEKIGGSLINFSTSIGKFCLFISHTTVQLFKPPFRFHLILRQLEFVGNKSFAIIFLASLFVGAVLGLQVGIIFSIFKAEGLLGAATAKALALELAPVMCGFIVTGRAGAAMAAEIATMRVNEQIDAMEAMGVNPLSYLIVPRVLASIIMMPILSGAFLTLGTIGAFILGQFYFSLDTQNFLSNLQWLVWRADIVKGLIKAAVFGGIFSIIACFMGYYARGGAKGVGEATTKSVVNSLLTILICDFFISLMQT